jgi:hypothetical protein
VEGLLEPEIQSAPLPKMLVHLPIFVDLPLGASCDFNNSASFALLSVSLQLNETDTSATGKICWTNKENVFSNDFMVETE